MKKMVSLSPTPRRCTLKEPEERETRKVVEREQTASEREEELLRSDEAEEVLTLGTNEQAEIEKMIEDESEPEVSRTPLENGTVSSDLGCLAGLSLLEAETNMLLDAESSQPQDQGEEVSERVPLGVERPFVVSDPTGEPVDDNRPHTESETLAQDQGGEKISPEPIETNLRPSTEVAALFAERGAKWRQEEQTLNRTQRTREVRTAEEWQVERQRQQDLNMILQDKLDRLAQEHREIANTRSKPQGLGFKAGASPQERRSQLRREETARQPGIIPIGHPLLHQRPAHEESWDEVREPSVQPMDWANDRGDVGETSGSSGGGTRRRHRAGRRRRKADPNNPRRQLQLDDYVSGNLDFGSRDDLSEAGAPIRTQDQGRETTEEIGHPGWLSREQRFPTRTTGVLFHGLAAIPTNPALDPPPRACFNCWQRGHQANQCKAPKTAVHCINCGRKNVAVRECPRCQEGCRLYRRNERRPAVDSASEGERQGNPFRLPGSPAPRTHNPNEFTRRLGTQDQGRTAGRFEQRDSSREDRERGPQDVAPPRWGSGDLRARLNETRNRRAATSEPEKETGVAPVPAPRQLPAPRPLPIQTERNPEEQEREREQRCARTAKWPQRRMQQLERVWGDLRDIPRELRELVLKRAFMADGDE